MSSELVFPGDEVAIEEEYMGGEGTFSDDGTVYASQVGVVEFDDEECIVKVVSPNPPNVLKEGDIVYAVVADIRNTMATADVVAKDGVDRTLGGETYATIHVSKISPKYTDGCIRALCSKCKTEMVKKGTGLYCPECKYSMPRKLADDYGDVKL